jgi:hypothetical protein
MGFSPCGHCSWAAEAAGGKVSFRPGEPARAPAGAAEVRLETIGRNRLPPDELASFVQPATALGRLLAGWSPYYPRFCPKNPDRHVPRTPCQKTAFSGAPVQTTKCRIHTRGPQNSIFQGASPEYQNTTRKPETVFWIFRPKTPSPETDGGLPLASRRSAESLRCT